MAAAEHRSVEGMAALILRSRQINRFCGTNLAPWELEALPAEWQDGLEMLVDDLPRVETWKNEVSAAMQRLRDRQQRRVQ